MDVGVAVVLVVLVVDDFVEVLVVVGDSVEEVVLVSVACQRMNFLYFRKIHHFEVLPLLSIIRREVL